MNKSKYLILVSVAVLFFATQTGHYQTKVSRAPAGIIQDCKSTLSSFFIRKAKTPSVDNKSSAEIIKEYIKSSIINKKLRSQLPMTKQDQEYAAALTQALEELPTYKGMSTRLTKFDIDITRFKKGETFSDPAFMSASVGIGADTQGDIVFNEVVMEIWGKSARDISRINAFEKEVIFLPGTKFEVEDIRASFKFNDITKTEIENEIEDVAEGYLKKSETRFYDHKQKVKKYKSYFKDFKVEEFKEYLELNGLDELVDDLDEINSIDELIKAGFDPVIHIVLREID